MIKKLFTILTLVSITSTMQANFEEENAERIEQLHVSLSHFNRAMELNAQRYDQQIEDLELQLGMLISTHTHQGIDTTSKHTDTDLDVQHDLLELQSAINILKKTKAREQKTYQEIYQNIFNELQQYMLTDCLVN